MLDAPRLSLDLELGMAAVLGGGTVPLSEHALGLKFTTAEYYWSDYWADTHALALRFKIPEYYA